ncbi:MAG: D-alanyl-D-alanine carboxypeptidase family protein [Aestuariivirgaceae bacterium]
MLLVYASAPAAAGPSLVFDARSGDVLLAHKAGDAWHPASLTKMMTAYVTFRSVKAGTISLEQKIKMTKEAAKQPPSKLGFRAGSPFSVDFAIRALMVHSANDIAVALGQAVAGGSEQRFVDRMNANAKRLGMTGTRFVNPHGLHDPNQFTTARDMGLLAATLIHEFPQFRSYFSLPYVKVGKRKLPNRNRLIGRMEGADGMKTGFICASGFNLVASATRNGRQLVAVVLGHKAAGPRTKFAELLLEAAFAGKGRYVGGNGRLAAISNQVGAPADMRKSVCHKRGVKLAKIGELSGWGVTFGKYKGPLTAEAMLDGQILLTRNMIDSGEAGVIRVPFTSDYVGTIWSMRQQTAQNLCSRLKSRSSHCEVVAPATFTEMARLSKKEAAKRAARKARKAKKRKKKKRIKKTSKKRKKTSVKRQPVKPKQTTQPQKRTRQKRVERQ